MGGERRAANGSAEVPTANGFTLLRVRTRGMPFAKIVYIKAHRSKKGSGDELPGDRTIFVANADCGEGQLRQILENFGEIERIAISKFHDSKKGGLSGWLPAFHDDHLKEQKDLEHAHVVFAKKSACKSALSCSDVVEIEDGEGAAAGGGLLRTQVEEHRSKQVPAKDLEDQVNAYMQYFDERTKAEKEAAKNKMVDDDGFELVTYKRKAPIGDPEAGIVERKPKKQLVNFYSFQIREKKREELAALRNKFEADKQRVESMKKKRLFKPF